MDWLWNNSPIINASSTLVIAVFTMIYAAVTIWLAFETRKLRRVQTTPRVTIRAEETIYGFNGYDLTIQNEGAGVAKNVRFRFEGDPSFFRNAFVEGGPPTIPELPIIKNGLDYLEHGQVHRFPLGTVLHGEFSRAAKCPWKFNVQYEDIYGKYYNNDYTVDFAIFLGGIFATNHLEEISDHLKGISKILDSKLR